MFPLFEQISICSTVGMLHEPRSTNGGHVSRAKQQTLRREDVTSLSLFINTVYLEFDRINQSGFARHLASFCSRTGINPGLTNNPNI
jgi:hypothetical protein